MKPYRHIRKASGYCCVNCDGPYSTYKKRNKKSLKTKDRELEKEEVEKQLEDYNDGIPEGYT